jgi:AraC-like DNA-binding protein
MSLYFVANTTEQLLFSDNLPDYLKPLVINGASCQACAGKFGYILHQQIDTPKFSLRQLHFHFNQPTRIGITQEEPLVEIYINLETEVQFHIHQIGNIALKTGAYNIIYSPFIKCEYFFQQGLNYKTLSVSCPPPLLASLAQAFPVMEKIVEKTKQHKPFLLFGGDARVSREMIHIIRELTTCSYTGELRDSYLEARTVDMLLLCLKNESRNGKRLPLRLRQHEILLIESVRLDLLQNLDTPYTLAQLATKSGLSKSKLARGFKHLTGSTVYGFQLRARMEKAKELLLTSDAAISSIGADTGYQAVDGFSKAFKKQYGLSPMDYRKKYGKQ